MQIDNKKIIIIFSVVLATILTMSISYYLINLANQPNVVNEQDQNNVDYQDPITECQGKKEVATNLVSSWLARWSTASTDPSGNLRAEGRGIAEEITTLLDTCSSFLDDQSRLDLPKFRDVIISSIERNIDYGPPCDPLCERGPPIT